MCISVSVIVTNNNERLFIYDRKTSAVKRIGNNKLCTGDCCQKIFDERCFSFVRIITVFLNLIDGQCLFCRNIIENVFVFGILYTDISR
jgi:hypothetical protein